MKRNRETDLVNTYALDGTCRRRLATVAALALTPSLAQSALGQSDAGNPPEPDAEGPAVKLPDVEVRDSKPAELSSPKFTTPLVDTPQTIAVIPAEVFNQQGGSTLSDVLRNTPGITFAAGEGGGVATGDSFYMRGYDASGSIYVDGVRDSAPYYRDVFNTEQVEIAKGPAGADNGRGGSSGYVNLATKTPQTTAFTRGQLSYGGGLSAGEPEQRATIDYNRPLSEQVGFRLNAMWQDAGTAGRDAVYRRAFGVAPSLAFQLGDTSRLTLNGSYEDQDGLPDSGLPIVALPGFAGYDVDQTNFYGLADHGFEEVENVKLGLRFDQSLGAEHVLTFQSRFIDTSRDMLLTRPSNSGPNGFNPATNEVFPTSSRLPQDYRIFANYLNVSGRAETGEVSHAYSVGAEVTDESRDIETWTNGAPFGTDLFSPNRHRVPAPDQLPTRAANEPFANGDVATHALYAFDTIGLSDRLALSLSARWERFEIDYESLSAPTTAEPAPAVSTVSKSDDLFSYKAGLTFKPVENGTFYVAVANSQVPPGTDLALSSGATNANNPVFDPQEASNFEIGAKWEFFERRLSTSVALYRSDNDNLTSTDASTGEVGQEIDQSSQGLEIGVSGRITNEWLVYGGLGYIDTSYNSAGTTAEGNDGAELRFAPELSGNLWTTFALARGLTLGGGVQYTDSVARSTSNTTSDTATSLSRIPAYWLVNLMAAYAVNEKITLRLNFDNIFDEENFRLNNNGGRYYPGTPRSLLLTADWSF